MTWDLGVIHMLHLSFRSFMNLNGLKDGELYVECPVCWPISQFAKLEGFGKASCWANAPHVIIVLSVRSLPGPEQTSQLDRIVTALAELVTSWMR